MLGSKMIIKSNAIKKNKKAMTAIDLIITLIISFVTLFIVLGFITGMFSKLFSSVQFPTAPSPTSDNPVTTSFSDTLTVVPGTPVQETINVYNNLGDEINSKNKPEIKCWGTNNDKPKITITANPVDIKSGQTGTYKAIITVSNMNSNEDSCTLTIPSSGSDSITYPFFIKKK